MRSYLWFLDFLLFATACSSPIQHGDKAIRSMVDTVGYASVRYE